MLAEMAQTRMAFADTVEGEGTQPVAQPGIGTGPEPFVELREVIAGVEPAEWRTAPVGWRHGGDARRRHEWCAKVTHTTRRLAWPTSPFAVGGPGCSDRGPDAVGSFVPGHGHVASACWWTRCPAGTPPGGRSRQRHRHDHRWSIDGRQGGPAPLPLRRPT